MWTSTFALAMVAFPAFSPVMATTTNRMLASHVTQTASCTAAYGDANPLSLTPTKYTDYCKNATGTCPTSCVDLFVEADKQCIGHAATTSAAALKRGGRS